MVASLECFHQNGIRIVVDADVFSVFFFSFFQIERAEFSCPPWFPVGAKLLIHRILDPNPETVSVCIAQQEL